MISPEATRLDANALAEGRTVMAAERTLLAWVRTSISLIGFGFTVYKFLELQYTKDATLAGQQAIPLLRHLEGPRNLAMTFIGLAVLSLGIAVLQYRQQTKRYGRDGMPRLDLTLVTAGFIAVIGILALTNVIFRVGPF